MNPWEMNWENNASPTAFDNQLPWERNWGGAPKSDIPTDAIRATYRGTMNTVAKPINTAINNIVAPVIGTFASAEEKPAQGIANAIDSTDAGQWIGDKLLSAKNSVDDIGANIKDLESYDPNLAKDLSAFGENTQFAGNLMGANAAYKGLAGNQFVKNIAEDLRNPPPPPPPGGGGAFPPSLSKIPITRPMVRSASQNAYQYADETGGILSPHTFTNDIMDTIENAKAKPIAGKVLTSEQKALNDALDEYSPLRDSPLTLTDYENLDKSLTAKESAAMDGFKSTANSRAIGQVQDAIRARLQALKPADVVGGKEGFDALTQHAIPLWSTQAKMGDLEAIINRANMMDNPTTAMRTGFRNLSLNDAKMAQYPKEVQDLIRKAASSGNVSDVLGILGSRLNPIMNSTMAGKATNMVTSKIFRGVRDSMQNAKADKILSAMTNPVRGSVERFTPSVFSEAPKMLTYNPEPITMSVAPEGPPSTIPMTPTNRKILGEGAGTVSERTPSAQAFSSMASDQGQSEMLRNMGTQRLNNYASSPKQDVMTTENAAETMKPKPRANIYSDIQAKVDRMPVWMQSERLNSLAKKATSNAGLSSAEMAEFEYLKSPKYSKGGSVKKPNLTAEFLARTRKRA